MFRGLRTGQLLILALVLGCSGCGSDDGGGSSAPGPLPYPSPWPSPTPTPSPQFVGAVYAGTDHVGNNSGFDVPENFVVAFGRSASGELTLIGHAETGGLGSGGVPGPNRPPRINPLMSEDSLLAVDDRYLLVVNAGSNSVTSFAINPDFSLTRVDVESSGGTLPISLAYRNGVVYVANADEDGVFTAPSNQSGNITAMRLDAATGQLTRIDGFSLSLNGRPSDLEVLPDGSHLIASSLNASSPQLPQPTAAEVSSFRILSDGTLATPPAGTGQSTPLNNAAGRNLPNAIGIETYASGGRQFVIAAEARTVSPTGMPAATFASVQTGSVSTWEVNAEGKFLPRSQDVMLGPTPVSGPLQAGFLAYSPASSTFWVTTTSGATISGYGLNPDGTLARGERVASGVAVDPTSATPLAGADGFGDITLSPDGRWLYQIVGLKGRIDVYEVDTLAAFNIALRQQADTRILRSDSLQGLVAVSARQP